MTISYKNDHGYYACNVYYLKDRYNHYVEHPFFQGVMCCVTWSHLQFYYGRIAKKQD
jgi:hypothetical protein